MALILLVNNQSVDIDTNQDFALTFQGANVQDLGVRNDTFGVTWNLPLTNNNRLIFGIIDSPDGDTYAAFNPQDAQIWSDSTLLLNGKCVVMDTDTNVLHLSVFGSLKPFINSLTVDEVQADGSVTTRDLTLRDLNIELSKTIYAFEEVANAWNDELIVDSLKQLNPANATQYAIFDNGTQNRFNWKNGLFVYNTSTGLTLPEYMLAPWFKVTNLLTGIVQNAGYNLIGNLEPIKTAVVSSLSLHGDADWVTNGNVNWGLVQIDYTKDYLVLGTVDVPLAGNGTYFNSGGGGTGGDGNGYEYGVGYGNFGIYSFGWVTVEFQYNFVFSSDATEFQAIDVKLVLNGINTEYYSQYHEIADSGKIFTGSAKIYITPNSRISLKISAADIGSVNFTLTWAPGEGQYFKVTPLDLLAPESKITERCLPKISQKDFLKDIAMRYGYIINVDDSRQEVQLTQLSNLVYRDQAIDWTDKLGSDNNAANVGQYRSYFHYGSLAKNNWYRNANGLLGTSKIVSNTYGVEISNDTYTSPLDVGIDGVKQYFDMYSGQKIMFDLNKDINLSMYDRVARLAAGDYVVNYGGIFAKALINDELPIYQTYEYVLPTDIYSITDIPIIANLTTIDLTATVWNDNNGNWLQVNGFSSATNTETNIVQSATFQYQYWAYLLPTYMAPIQDALLNPRVDSLLLHLLPSDLSNLDFTIPIKVGDKYYYLNQVYQFNPATLGLTQVDLLLLP